MYKDSMRAMPAVPIEVLPYVRGIQLVLSSYEGYTKGKRREADKLIRDEIKRAGTRARNHISNIQDIAFILDGATHYHADYVYPEWRKSKHKVVQIGNHIFYKWQS